MEIKKSDKKDKKYKAVFKEKDGKTKTIHFGDKRYEHYKDRTPLKAFSNKDHGDR
jgi:hypothetical protein